jgi:lipid II:glycine glycyltransferase (peptidoglycan interpeptide bridge formation enzyme)
MTKAGWHDLLDHYDDANIYQTWSYEVQRSGLLNVHHLVLQNKGKIVAAAQARVLQFPLLRTGIAYVRWGPLWIARGEQRSPEIFRLAIRALRKEFVENRGLMLRIFPILYKGEDRELEDILYEEGYKVQKQKEGKRTLLLDLRPSLEDLRKNLDQKWRNCLNRAEKNSLDVIEGEGDELFGLFINIYREMLSRKKFAPPNDINEFRSIQQDLPPHLKMRVFLSKSGSDIGAGAICSAMGNKGVYLFGATNEKGMSSKGSYLLQWRIIQWLKDSGFIWYDLNGISPSRNPGTYQFKAGVAGKSGRDVLFLGQFDYFASMPGRILSAYGDQVLSLLRRSRSLLRSRI